MSTHTHTQIWVYLSSERPGSVSTVRMCVCLSEWKMDKTARLRLFRDKRGALACRSCHCTYMWACMISYMLHTHTHTHVSCYSLILLQWWGTQDTRRHISCMCVCADGGSVFMFSSVGLLRLTITGVRPKCLNPAFFLCAFTGLCGWFPNELMVPINSFHFSSSQDEHPCLN